MEIKKTDFNGVLILQPKVLEDARGSFMESYRSEWFAGVKFIQDNESVSKKGVIRGLHFQRPPFAQSKLIRVLYGRILDVIVDLRKSSDTFGQVFSIELSSENKTQLLVPKGFAHGYATLSDTATVLYKVDQYYNKTYDTGIHPLSESLSIDWQVSDALLSEKDQSLIDFKDFKSPFE
jgi:dTDP-4-dehydrorhamnose 3,5-epimerase